MHTILDEIIVGGQVLETSSSEVVKAVDEISRFCSLSLPPPPHSLSSCLYNNVMTSTLQVGEDLNFNHACSEIALYMARAVNKMFCGLIVYPLCRRRNYNESVLDGMFGNRTSSPKIAEISNLSYFCAKNDSLYM